MPKVLVTDPIAQEGVDYLAREAEVEVRLKPAPEELLAMIGGYDGLIVRSQTKVTRAVIEAGKRLQVIHIVGGGSRNQVLNQFVADATGRLVVVGPSEATAAGNILVQAIGSGLLSDLADAREVVKRSFPLETIEPGPAGGWDEAYARNLAIGCQHSAISFHR